MLAYVEKLETSYVADDENVNWYSLCKAVWWFFKRLNIVLLYDPAVLLLGIYIPKRNENMPT